MTTAAAPAVARERQERADSLEPATVSAAASPDAERRLSVESFEARSAIAPVSAGLSETSPTLVVVAPDGATTWQVTASGIEKSTDGGSSWTQQTGLSGDVTAGAAPSASVCWLVGRRGFILRTVDGGGSWLQLGAPSDADVIGIEALDGERAVVELADGRTLRTEDGGMTWQVGQASR